MAENGKRVLLIFIVIIGFLVVIMLFQKQYVLFAIGEGTIDQNQSEYNTIFATDYVGQSFIPSSSELKKIELNLKKSSLIPPIEDISFTLNIWDSVNRTNLVGSLNNYKTLYNTFSWYEFIFPASISLNLGQQYYFEIYHVIGNTSFAIQMYGIDNYNNGKAYYAYNKIPLVIKELPGDLTFKTYSSMAAACNTPADTNCDNIVSRAELANFIMLWTNNQATRENLGNAIMAWVGG